MGREVVKGGGGGGAVAIIHVLMIQPVSYKRYFRCINCFLRLVYTINLSLSTDLVD